MRKYATHKAIYVLLVAILLCLSIGYTYAYFSAVHEAKSNVEFGVVDMCWVDNNSDTNEPIKGTYDNDQTTKDESMSIQLVGDLKRSEYTLIKVKSSNSAVLLEASNSNSNIPVYCRIKIDATYTTKDGIQNTCDDGWIQLALDFGSGPILLTDINMEDHGIDGWFYDNGYYYYGTKTESGNTKTVNLTEISAYGGQVVANYLYLDTSASSEMLGCTVNIVLTLEGVQTKYYNNIWTELGLQDNE